MSTAGRRPAPRDRAHPLGLRRGGGLPRPPRRRGCARGACGARRADATSSPWSRGMPPPTRGLLLLTHIDVVPVGPGWTRDPWDGALEDGRVCGRGANDAKASAAAMAWVAGPRGPRRPCAGRLVVVLACDEETGGEGIEAVRDDLPPYTAAVVGEPTGARRLPGPARPAARRDPRAGSKLPRLASVGGRERHRPPPRATCSRSSRSTSARTTPCSGRRPCRRPSSRAGRGPT